MLFGEKKSYFLDKTAVIAVKLRKLKNKLSQFCLPFSKIFSNHLIPSIFLATFLCFSFLVMWLKFLFSVLFFSCHVAEPLKCLISILNFSCLMAEVPLLCTFFSCHVAEVLLLFTFLFLSCGWSASSLYFSFLIMWLSATSLFFLFLSWVFVLSFSCYVAELKCLFSVLFFALEANAVVAGFLVLWMSML